MYALLLLGALWLAACDGVGDGREWITITQAGLEHVFGNGVTLRVPAGAVDEDTRFYLRTLAPEEIAFFTQARGLEPQALLFALEGTDGVTFVEDVTLIVPAPNLAAGDVPIVHTLDLAQRTFSQQRAAVVVQPEAGTLEFRVGHFCGLTAEAKAELKRAAEECTNPATACRCKEIEVLQEDFAGSCSQGDCQVIRSQGSVRFLGCPNTPTESYLFEEVSSGCATGLTLTPGRAVLEPGGQTAVVAQATIGCAPLGDQAVQFSVAGPGTIDTLDARTDAGGEARTTLTAGQEQGLVTVAVEADLVYYAARIVIQGQVQKEERRTDHLLKSADVVVVAVPVLELAAARATMRTDESVALEAAVRADGQLLADQTVTFRVSGPARVDPASATTSADAPARATLTAQGEGTATVTASCTVRVRLPTGRDQEVVLEQQLEVRISDEQAVETWSGSYHADTLGKFAMNSADIEYEVAATLEFTAFDPTCPARNPAGYESDSWNLCGTGTVDVALTPVDDPYGCTLVSPRSASFPVVLVGQSIEVSGQRRLTLVDFQPADPSARCSMTYSCCDGDTCEDQVLSGGVGCHGNALVPSPANICVPTPVLEDPGPQATVSGTWLTECDQTDGGGWEVTITRID
ncbi:MAG TPA: hypothetical protein PK668_12890 [Myxococcota bacterium]|nr:hypothetical protein [Myxococcota bacterium]HRY93633.1 hypothetical protein [Myxococcota bacterium]